MGAHAVIPTLRKLRQENYHNLTQWVTDQTSLDYNVTLHTSNKPIHTHKDKTQILINNLINSNKQIKMQSASFQYRSIASPVWQSTHTLVSLAPCASFTAHCCRLPSKQKQPSFSATLHTESRFLLFWMCGEAHLPSEAAQSPKWATWFCRPFQYTPFLYVLSLGLLLRKSTRSFCLLLFRLHRYSFSLLLNRFIIFWFCITKFLHVSSTWCWFNFLDL